ncbi:uncharacterized protein [Asterias amurensis]|uniref:uncharacterized protein n=1 Tax=Asterias amurensis TaxID=7602 RepID=UPI003AB392AE
MPKSNRNCAVGGCSHTQRTCPKGRFVGFPNQDKQPERRQTWINLVQRGANWIPTKNSRVCACHFMGGYKVDDPSDPAYNPSIFPLAPELDRRVKKTLSQEYLRRRQAGVQEGLYNESAVTLGLALQPSSDPANDNDDIMKFVSAALDLSKEAGEAYALATSNTGPEGTVSVEAAPREAAPPVPKSSCQQPARQHLNNSVAGKRPHPGNFHHTMRSSASMTAGRARVQSSSSTSATRASTPRHQVTAGSEVSVDRQGPRTNSQDHKWVYYNHDRNEESAINLPSGSNEYTTKRRRTLYSSKQQYGSPRFQRFAPSNRRMLGTSSSRIQRGMQSRYIVKTTTSGGTEKLQAMDVSTSQRSLTSANLPENLSTDLPEIPHENLPVNPHVNLHKNFQGNLCENLPENLHGKLHVNLSENLPEKLPENQPENLPVINLHVNHHENLQENHPEPHNINCINPQEFVTPSLVTEKPSCDACIQTILSMGPQDDSLFGLSNLSPQARGKCYGFHGWSDICFSNSTVERVAGVTPEVFDMLLGYLPGDSPGLPPHNSLLLVLMKLKMAVPFEFLATIFGITSLTACNIFTHLSSHLVSIASDLIQVPRNTDTSSEQTGADGVKVNVIIDFMEIRVDHLTVTEHHNHFFCSVSGAHCVKIIVGLLPSGYVSYISQAYVGSANAIDIFGNSDFMHFLDHSSTVLLLQSNPYRQKWLRKRGFKVVTPSCSSIQVVNKLVTNSFENCLETDNGFKSPTGSFTDVEPKVFLPSADVPEVGSLLPFVPISEVDSSAPAATVSDCTSIPPPATVSEFASIPPPATISSLELTDQNQPDHSISGSYGNGNDICAGKRAQRLRSFSILTSTIEGSLLPYIDDVVRLCAALSNLQDP